MSADIVKLLTNLIGRNAEDDATLWQAIEEIQKLRDQRTESRAFLLLLCNIVRAHVPQAQDTVKSIAEWLERSEQ